MFEELDRRPTAIGEVSLRRRLEPMLQVEVYEARLDDEFLMSSLFTVGERALATLGLESVEGDALDVVVGGLGLGYTALTVLADERVRSLQVVEALDPVIEWHRQGLLPDAHGMLDDPRCTVVHGDFFALVGAGHRLGREGADRYHAVLVDIDHTPRHVLDESHRPFYTVEGLGRLTPLLHPGGVFGLWSDDPPDAEFGAVAEVVFASSDAHVVSFPNHYTGGESSNTVYLATR